MVNLIQLFPPYLIIFTLVFVIFPTIIVWGIRVKLYHHLADASQKVTRLLTRNPHGQQPLIVRKLEDRFRRASLHLEYVNTSALLDGIYSEETFSFLSYSLRCEQWDYFSRILPNLLLTFGLLGTFLGITLNLNDIGWIIHKGSIDNSNLVGHLQKPLQNMGIAFFTSLIALSFSSFLTLINLKYNTGLAKNKLVNSLEDYLDNVFHPTIEGNTRLDKSVNRMVEQQNEFLTRFHENVTKAVESSLGRVAQQIADGNKESALLAKQVYERLTEACGTLANGATTFQLSTYILEQQIQRAIEITDSVKETSQKLESSALIFQAASEKIEQSKFSDNLENLTSSLAATQEKFTESTALFNKNISKMIEGNKKTNNLAEQVYLSFEDSTTKIQDSALVFLEASEKIEQSQFADNLFSATQGLMTTYGQFSEAISDLTNSIKPMTSFRQDLQSSIYKIVNLESQISDINKNLVNFIQLNQKQLESGTNNFHSFSDKLLQSIESFETFQETLSTDIQNLGNNISDSLNNLINIKNDENQQILQTIEIYLKDLSIINSKLSNLVDAVSQNNKQILEKQYQILEETIKFNNKRGLFV